MHRKPGYPPNSCNIKMPEFIPQNDNSSVSDDDTEPIQRRQQLINFGHTQWGFNNWNWSVTKQDLDFVDFSNGKYSVGVVAYVSVSVKVFEIHRENIGYATANATQKGLAIHKARKCAVTNALRETLLSFGANVARDLLELDSHKVDYVPQFQSGLQLLNNNNATSLAPNIIESYQENNQNTANKPPIVAPMGPVDSKMAPLKQNMRKDSTDSGGSKDVANMRSPHTVGCVSSQNGVKPLPSAAAPPMTKTQPAPHRVAPAPAPAPAPVRPNSNEANKIENMTEEELRAERRRRQKMAQEEFRLKQLQKQNVTDGDNDFGRSSIDNILKEIQTQDILSDYERKRKSPEPNYGSQNKKPLI